MSRAYGTWASPISGASIAGGVSLRDVQWNRAGDTLVWWENRAKTGVLQAQTSRQAPRDLTDSTLNVAGRVGYGGGAFTLADGKVFFVADGRLHGQALAGGAPGSISPKLGSYASPAVSPDGGWVAFVHSYEHIEGLAIVDAAGEDFPRKLAYGTDFVMQPTWHPGGRHIAFVAWNHPQMPWNGSELRLVSLAFDGAGMPRAQDIVTVAGDMDTAIFQPEFSSDGRYLSYISDASGWSQIYLYDLEERAHRQLTREAVEHGTPAWAQGMRTYAWARDSLAIFYLENRQGFVSLRRYDVASSSSEMVRGLEAYTDMEQISVSLRKATLSP